MSGFYPASIMYSFLPLTAIGDIISPNILPNKNSKNVFIDWVLCPMKNYFFIGNSCQSYFYCSPRGSICNHAHTSLLWEENELEDCLSFSDCILCHFRSSNCGCESNWYSAFGSFSLRIFRVWEIQKSKERRFANRLQVCSFYFKSLQENCPHI